MKRSKGRRKEEDKASCCTAVGLDPRGYMWCSKSSRLCLWAGKHWGVLKAQDFISLHGEASLESCLGNKDSDGGDTQEVPSRSSSLDTVQTPSRVVCLSCSLLPRGSAVTAQGKLRKLHSASTA